MGINVRLSATAVFMFLLGSGVDLLGTTAQQARDERGCPQKTRVAKRLDGSPVVPAKHVRRLSEFGSHKYYIHLMY